MCWLIRGGEVKPSITDAARNMGIELSKRGNELVGVCPLHQDTDPSFSINPDKGVFLCRGCNAGGDVYDLVMAVRGCSFVEAKEYLGVKDNGPTREDLRQRAIRNGLRGWCRDYLSTLVTLRNIYEEVTDPEFRASLADELLVIQHHIDILIYGTQDDKVALAREVARTPLI